MCLLRPYPGGRFQPEWALVPRWPIPPFTLLIQGLGETS